LELFPTGTYSMQVATCPAGIGYGGMHMVSMMNVELRPPNPDWWFQTIPRISS